MKKKTETTTPEEHAIRTFRNIKKLNLLPAPTRFFKIGEGVCIGNLIDCKIIKPLFENKAYLVEYTSVDRDKIKKVEMGVWDWLSIFRHTDRMESFIEDKDIFIQYSQTGISDLLIKMYQFGTDMNPIYQRDYVWSEEDKVSLIDSIYKNVDIGKFVFVRLHFGGDFSYEILDGKQRLNAIKEFYEDRLLYNGFKFSELSVKDRYHFREFSIATCSVQECNLKQKLKIFYKLNISGKVMDKKHLEKINKMILKSGNEQ